jgi:hypothetical protein
VPGTLEPITCEGDVAESRIYAESSYHCLSQRLCSERLLCPAAPALDWLALVASVRLQKGKAGFARMISALK